MPEAKRLRVKRFASGKYHVYWGEDRLPCVIVGGNRKYNLESGGKFLGQFSSVKLAAEIFYGMHDHGVK